MAIMFDEALAIEYGVDEAIFISNLYFWIRKNEANEKHFYDGRTWTYNTFQAWCALFPFWSEKQVRRIVKRLSDCGAILTGNYNKIAFDRTLWYALSDEALSICRNGHMHLPKRANEKCPNGQMRSAQTGAPIPDSKPDVKPNNTPLPPAGETEKPNVYGKRFARFWAAYPRKQAKGNAEKVFVRLKVSAALLDKMLEAIAWQQTTEEWKKDNGQFIPHPASWLNSKRWEDEKSNYTTAESKYKFVN
jgi:hypothetical protein